jgi:FAD/FMN-containing dehydrogenase
VSAEDRVPGVGDGALTPGEVGFDDARSVWNGRFDRRPAVAARCRNADDVAAALSLAREQGLSLSVKGAGHSYAGNTIADGGLLVDLSPMKAVRVDVEAQLATVEAGVTCGELDAATQEFGLAAVLPTVSSVGVAGATLGGGSGYLSPKFGLSLDNLVAVELVTADGRLVRASEREHPDLFWAMRGAGANFGVATSLQFRLHPVGPEVLAGQIMYPFERAGELLRFFRDYSAGTPAELQCYPFMFRIPPVEPFPESFHGRLALDFVFCHPDPTATGSVEPLREQGETILDMVAPTPYLGLQQSFDAGLPAGQRYYSKAHSLDHLSDAVIDTIVAHVPSMLGPFTVVYLEPPAPAVAAVASSATAYAGRGDRWGFHVLAGWTDPEDDEPVMTWARNFHRAVAAHSTDWVYVNLLADDESSRVPAAYGANHDRLVELKTQWDPENIFQGNHNIEPSP